MLRNMTEIKILMLKNEKKKNLSFKYLQWIKIENMNRNQNNVDTDILR